MDPIVHTPDTDRLRGAANAEQLRPEISIQLLGFLAVVEQIELLRDETRQHALEIAGLLDSTRDFQEEIKTVIDNRSIDHANLADAIAHALEQRGVIR